MPNYTTSGTVSEDLTVKWENPAGLKAWLAGAKGLLVHVTWDRRPRRSTQANRRYFGQIIPFAQQIWEQERGYPFTRELAHHTLKLAFLGHDEVMVGGQMLMVPKPSRTLSKQEFSDYCTRCEAWIEECYGVTPKELGSYEEIA